MMKIDAMGNRWVKGNLHTHTSLSDGRVTPEDCKRMYKEKGYDFIAITDHWKFGVAEESDDFLVLPGAEYNFNGDDVLKGVYHIVGIGMKEDPLTRFPDLREQDAQTCIDRLHELNGFAVLAHPAWSMNTCEQILKLRRYDASEIMNTVSGPPYGCRPYSGLHLDEIACRGVFPHLLGVDDVHFYKEDFAENFIWLCIGKNPLTASHVLEALRNGNFFASQQPFYTLRREIKNGKQKLTFLFSDEEKIHSVTFFNDKVWIPHRCILADPGQNLLQAEYTLDDDETFVRIEIENANGQKAFSPYFTH